MEVSGKSEDLKTRMAESAQSERGAGVALARCELTPTHSVLHVSSDQRWLEAREQELREWHQEINEWLAASNRGIDDLCDRHAASGREVNARMARRFEGRQPSLNIVMFGECITKLKAALVPISEALLGRG
jgi:hypothetical protein